MAHNNLNIPTLTSTATGDATPSEIDSFNEYQSQAKSSKYLEKTIRSLVIKKEEKPISPRGETRNISIYGSAGAIFTLTIKDSSNCSILEEEILDAI